jgi:hypothetical protein
MWSDLRIITCGVNGSSADPAIPYFDTGRAFAIFNRCIVREKPLKEIDAHFIEREGNQYFTHPTFAAYFTPFRYVVVCTICVLCYQHYCRLMLSVLNCGYGVPNDWAYSNTALQIDTCLAFASCMSYNVRALMILMFIYSQVCWPARTY